MAESKKNKEKKKPEQSSDLLKKTKVKKKTERISTGISRLDKLTNGGFEANSVNLLIGGSGNGKSVFSIQFIMQGLKKGENCLYISFEEKKTEFFNNMKQLGFNLEDYEKKGNFIFLEYTPEKVRKMLNEGGGAIEATVLNKKVSRLVIDSITAFSMLFEGEHEQRQAVLNLFNMLRKWDCSTLITYERDPLLDERHTSRILEFESDAIIYLYFFRNDSERERYLEIIKMRGTKHSKEIWPYDIKENGIEIADKPFKGKLPNK
ncbi:MAG: RAD55 family ATPase [Candidatus Nanoarchaeia archaeon]